MYVSRILQHMSTNQDPAVDKEAYADTYIHLHIHTHMYIYIHMHAYYSTCRPTETPRLIEKLTHL
jgi:hypothetical protein